VSTAVILGAGDIGGALARQLAAVDLVSRIVIVDDLANVAAGKALDVAQSAPVDRYHTTMAGTADVAAVVGAAVVLVADTAQPMTEWKDDAGLALVKRAAGLNQLAPIVCAGAAQAGVIEKAVNELAVARTRVFGSAPEALRSAIVALVALESNAAPADISLSVLGRAPGQIIVPWDEAAIAGSTRALRGYGRRGPTRWPAQRRAWCVPHSRNHHASTRRWSRSIVMKGCRDVRR
jgi:malate dehydrogenase